MPSTPVETGCVISWCDRSHRMKGILWWNSLGREWQTTAGRAAVIHLFLWEEKNNNYNSFIVSSLFSLKSVLFKDLTKVAFFNQFLMSLLWPSWMNRWCVKVWLKSEIKWSLLVQRWLNGCMSEKNEIQHHSTPSIHPFLYLLYQHIGRRSLLESIPAVKG